MNDLKKYLLEFIWLGESIDQFEKWLYKQDSCKFEKLIGEDSYMDLISYDYRKKTIQQIKSLIKSILTDEIRNEFNIEFENRNRSIKGTCIKTIAWNPWGKEMRDWELQVGKKYEFIIVSKGTKNKKYPQTVNFVDRENYLRPSGFIPAELFDIDLENISDLYQIVETDDFEQLIELTDLSDKFFWEDFYDDEERAVNRYYDTLDKLGIKNVW